MSRRGRTASLDWWTSRTAAWVEPFDVLGGVSCLADDPVVIFLDDQILNLRRVMKRKHNELPRVRTYGLVDRQRERESKGAISVRTLAQKLIGDVRAELMGQRLNSLVHFPKECLVLGQATFADVHVPSTRAVRPEFRCWARRWTVEIDLTADLEKVLARTRRELEVLAR
jgi:hypothetical protein